MSDRVYVIAYSRVAFETYCYENGLNPLAANVHHVASPDRLRGLSGVDIRVHSFPPGRSRLEWEEHITLAGMGRWRPGDVVTFNDQTWARVADHHNTGNPWIKLTGERATTWLTDREISDIAGRNASFRFVWRHPEPRSPEGGKGSGCCTSAVDSTTGGDTTEESAERPEHTSVSLEPGATCGICEAYTGHRHYKLVDDLALLPHEVG